MKNNKQTELFDDIDQSLWIGMPEFIQEKKEPYKLLNIRFETQEDYEEFSKLINQKLTVKTKSIWYPELDRHKNRGVYYGK